MLARAIAPLVSRAEDLSAGLEAYQATFAETHRAILLRKLGLQPAAVEEDETLLQELDEALAASKVDMTLFFRQLSHSAHGVLSSAEGHEGLFEGVIDAAAYTDSPAGHTGLLQWLPRYALRLRNEGRPADAVRDEMLRANPKYVLRNYLAQTAIEAADGGDLAPLERLMRVLRTPFDEQPEHDDLAAKRPDWARDRPGCATLSCSS
jgi:uncharacterized protein YdiU (UPF0061 family)